MIINYFIYVLIQITFIYIKFNFILQIGSDNFVSLKFTLLLFVDSKLSLIVFLNQINPLQLIL